MILYWLDGGPTHMETYDPKPEAPAEYRGPFGAIETSAPGIRVNELLVHHAQQMDKVSLIRSMHHNNGDHFAAGHWMLTGYHGSTAADLDPQYPSMGAVITKIKGANKPNIPAYVAVPYAATIGLRPGYMSAAYLGVAYNPFDAGNPNQNNYKVKNLHLPGDVTLDRIGDRKALLGSLDRLRRDADDQGLMKGLDSFNQQAFDMLTGEEARRAFDIDKEDPRIRDRYGRHTYGQSALLARRLVEAGATFVNVHNGGWDHHSNIEGGMKSRLPSMDQSIGALIEDLDQRGMLDDVIVCVMGEFGRTPRVNGGAGRDHWGNVMSVLLGGGGLTGGQVIGASNAKGEFPAEQPIKPADVLATIYRTMDIELETNFVKPRGPAHADQQLRQPDPAVDLTLAAVFPEEAPNRGRLSNKAASARRRAARWSAKRAGWPVAARRPAGAAAPARGARSAGPTSAAVARRRIARPIPPSRCYAPARTAPGGSTGPGGRRGELAQSARCRDRGVFGFAAP